MPEILGRPGAPIPHLMEAIGLKVFDISVTKGKRSCWDQKQLRVIESVVHACVPFLPGLQHLWQQELKCPDMREM